ncbi:uncharacterized protein rab11fip5b isoform X2 [Stigmatopora argus]
MMSLVDLDDDQRWVPTHVNVALLRARGLRTKSKHGSRYLYAVVQVGKNKYTTGLVDKADVPVWSEECCFELLPGILEEDEEGGRGAYPPGCADLVVTVMHRVLIGLDVFLGRTLIPLDRMFREGSCPREEWFKLHSKASRKAKERGELQLTVQFTRNNMTASMFDLTAKDERRSAFGRLKDRVTGRKRPDAESSSAIVPGRYAALSAPSGQPSDDETGAEEMAEEKRNKMKDFFKGKLKKSADTRSCSSLASESSASSVASETLGPPPALGLLSDLPSSPVYSVVPRVEPRYGEGDRTKTVLSSRIATKIPTHKRASSDDASKMAAPSPPTNPTTESVGERQSMSQSQSSVCINGSHVYDSEPSIPKNVGTTPSKLVLLEKCSPLSRSLQNLAKDKGSLAEGRRWSFDKAKKEEQKEAGPPEIGVLAEPAANPSAADSSDKGWKLRKNLFSGGRSDSVPTKSDGIPAAAPPPEGRFRGWFTSTDPQNKPRLKVSPKLENNTNLPACNFVVGHTSSTSDSPFIEQPPPRPLTPPSTPISPSNPFFEELQRSPPGASSSSTFRYTSPHSTHGVPGPTRDPSDTLPTKRERPRPLPKQISLPEFLPQMTNTLANSREWEDSFDTFASYRLNSPGGNPSQMPRFDDLACHFNPQAPPLPPRRPKRTLTKEINSDGWLHRGQELAVHKEAYLLSRTGVASLQHARESACKRLSSSVSPENQTSDSAHLNSQIRGLVPSPSEETLKKYQPLEDVTDFWGGMLFEQDLYGRVSRVGQPYFHVVNNNTGLGTVPECKTTISCPWNQSSDFLSMSELKTTPSSTPYTNNNASFTLTSEDLDANVSHFDFGFVDSDGSSHSDAAEGMEGLSHDSQSAVHREVNANAFKDTKLLLSDSSLDKNTCKVSPVCQDFLFETNSVSNLAKTQQNQSDPALDKTESNDAFKETRKDRDDNGNLRTELELFPAVASARVRPKGIPSASRTELGLLSSLLNEGPSSYQPKKSAPSPNVALSDHEDNILFNRSPRPDWSLPSEDHLTENPSEMGFEILHAKVSPHLTSPPKSAEGCSLPSSPHLPFSTSNTGEHSGGTSRSLVVPPYRTSSCSSFNLSRSTTDLQRSLLTEEPGPDCNMLYQESRPHPVKPLSQSEKKESRSVFEKLKSTISPGRSAQQVAAEPTKIQEPTEDRSALYEHLNNMELISLLLQQDIDMSKERAASELQQAQLEKCEAELKKVKAQVRDLEDYIDNLLLRIIEQTPTLLQVRSRHK